MANFKLYNKTKSKNQLKLKIYNYYKDLDTDIYENGSFEKQINSQQVFKIWQKYKISLERKRPETALNLSRFNEYIFREDIKVFRLRNSYVFGAFIDGIFFPSHFSPYSLKEGVQLFQQLKKKRVVLFVPEDLSSQAERLGFIKIMADIPAVFRDKVILKNVLVSSLDLIPHLKDIQKEYNLFPDS